MEGGEPLKRRKGIRVMKAGVTAEPKGAELTSPWMAAFEGAVTGEQQRGE